MESLTRKAQIQEVELERTNKQLKEAIAIAAEETAKCKAAKEVIKSLTAQVFFRFLHPLPTPVSHDLLISSQTGKSRLWSVLNYC